MNSEGYTCIWEDSFCRLPCWKGRPPPVPGMSPTLRNEDHIPNVLYAPALHMSLSTLPITHGGIYDSHFVLKEDDYFYISLNFVKCARSAELYNFWSSPC